jgi:hypothetical protein
MSLPHPATVAMLPLSAITPAEIEAWSALECEALEPNVYLSPPFVLAAARHLTPTAAPVLLMARVSGRLAGLGVFEHAAASWRLPCRHLRTYLPVHAFLSGLLVHRDHAPEVVSGVLHWMARHPDAPPALAIEGWLATGPTATMLRDSAPAFGLDWWSHSQQDRAILHRESAPAAAGPQMSKRRRSRLRLALGGLAAKGAVRWDLKRGAEVTPAVVDRFLALEAMGWKGEAGTALLSAPEHAAFFRDVVAALAVGERVFFTELWCGDRIIASTSNFVAGRVGFAFKLGWDPAFRDQSPGLLNERFLMERFPDLLPGVDYLDSGAQPGSFIEELWPDRTTLEWGCLVSGRILKLHQRIFFGLRSARRAVTGRLRATPGPSAVTVP